ncbi:MAG: hypothetical protein H6625_09985 [Bdellovibrionaceae bacterium]|nr:hypothetical protein [Pseudobdellovibrionaceae bacterium]
MKELKRILFASNSSRHAWRHRSDLALTALRSGYEVYFMCPTGTEVSIMQSVGIHHVPIELNRNGVNIFRELWTLIQFSLSFNFISL